MRLAIVFLVGVVSLGYVGRREVQKTIAVCEEVASSREAFQECWRRVFTRVAGSQGINVALSYLSQVKNSDIAVATECHVYAHAIGEVAYERLEQNKLDRVTADTSLCNFGYFHGLMQEYASHSKKLAEAKDFCESQRRDRVTQCFHGIGHGLVYGYAVVGKPDEETIVTKAILDCDRLVPEKDTRRAECFNGVFGGIAAVYFTLHGFSYQMRPEDPFWLCKKQLSQYQKYCYDELVPPLFNLVRFDMVKAGRFIEEIVDRQIRELAAEHLGLMPAHIDLLTKTNYEEVVSQCRLFAPDLIRACLRGVVKSLVMFGNMIAAVGRAVDFCEKYMSDAGEREECQKTMIEQIKFSYAPAQQNQICKSFAKQIPALCID